MDARQRKIQIIIEWLKKGCCALFLSKKFNHVLYFFEKYDLKNFHDIFLKQNVSDIEHHTHQFSQKNSTVMKRFIRYSSKGLDNSFFAKSRITETSIESKRIKSYNFLLKSIFFFSLEIVFEVYKTTHCILKITR